MPAAYYEGMVQQQSFPARLGCGSFRKQGSFVGMQDGRDERGNPSSSDALLGRSVTERLGRAGPNQAGCGVSFWANKNWVGASRGCQPEDRHVSHRAVVLLLPHIGAGKHTACAVSRRDTANGVSSASTVWSVQSIRLFCGWEVAKSFGFVLAERLL
jgi:hypothetical protein